MMRAIRLAVVCGALMVAGQVEAAMIYSTSGAGTQLATINSSTGAGAVIGSAGAGGAYAAAFDTNGTLYGILNWSTGSNRLGTYNLSTGQIIAVSANTFSNSFMLALEINSSGVLYGGSWGTTNNFFQINKATGIPTVIGSTGFDGVMDFAFDSSGQLWGVGGLGSLQLFKINTTTGASTFVANITGTAGQVMGIMFDGSVLYATDFIGNSRLYTVNTGTGAATFVGTTGLNSAHGGDILAISEVPEPSSLALLSIGGIGMVLGAVRRRRQKQAV